MGEIKYINSLGNNVREQGNFLQWVCYYFSNKIFPISVENYSIIHILQMKAASHNNQLLNHRERYMIKGGPITDLQPCHRDWSRYHNNTIGIKILKCYYGSSSVLTCMNRY